MVKKRPSAPTMKDVAREAGVSLGTVSKVINGIPVGDAYRLRVESAAKSLGYTVNNYARGLKTNRTNCVALVIPSLRHPFFAVLADEISACLARHGYHCILMITNFDPEAERNSLVMVRQNKADGIIALTYSPNLEVDESLPIVTIDRHFSEGIPCVSSDNFHGGELAAETLTRLGCRNLLMFQIGAEVPGEPHKRCDGFEHFCRAEDVRFHSIVLRDADTEAPFYAYLAEHIQNGAPDFDGIFCSSDMLACGVRAFLSEHGVGVPEDVQIIGYDGITDYSTGRYLCSTIVQPIPDMARTAVDILLGWEARLMLPVRYAPGGTTRDKEEQA